MGFSIPFPLAPKGLTGLEKEPSWIGMQEYPFRESLNMDAEPMGMVAWRNGHETKQQLTLNKLFWVNSLLVCLSYPCLPVTSRPSPRYWARGFMDYTLNPVSTKQMKIVQGKTEEGHPDKSLDLTPCPDEAGLPGRKMKQAPRQFRCTVASPTPRRSPGCGIGQSGCS